MREMVPVGLTIFGTWATESFPPAVALNSTLAARRGWSKEHARQSAHAPRGLNRYELRNIGITRFLHYCLGIWRQPETLGNQRAAVEEYLAQILEVIAVQ
jgi:hypothetical protein